MVPPDESASPPSDDVPRTFPQGGPTLDEREALRATLLRLRSSLLRSNHDLANEALKGSGQDFSIDHLADHASDNTEQEISIALLQGETDLLNAIEEAIHKIDGNRTLPFGLCEICATEGAWDPETTAPWIPTGRLHVVPYARLCIPHQEEQEES